MELRQLVVQAKGGASNEERDAELAAALIKTLMLVLTRVEGKSPELAFHYAKTMLEPLLSSFTVDRVPPSEEVSNGSTSEDPSAPADGDAPVRKREQTAGSALAITAHPTGASALCFNPMPEPYA